MLSAIGPTSAATRSFISSAARLVKVMAKIWDSNLLPLRNNRPARVAYHRAIHGHRLHHHAPGPYACVVSDYYRPQHLGPGSNDHIVANSGVALACLLARSTKRHALVQSDIVPYLRGLPYDNTRSMVNEQPLAYGGARVYLYLREEATKLRQ